MHQANKTVTPQRFMGITLNTFTSLLHQHTLVDLIGPNRFLLQAETTTPDIGLFYHIMVNTYICTCLQCCEKVGKT